MLGSFWQDVRFSLRTLARKRAFTGAAVLTIALGIGSNAAVFSVVNAVLFSPLPYPDSDRLFAIWTTIPERGVQRMSFSARNFEDIRAENAVFEECAILSSLGGNLTGGEWPERVSYAALTPGLFEVLKVGPALGRAFREDENLRGNDKVAVISHGFWQNRFAGDPEVLGRTLVLDGEVITVIGVMPASFVFPNARTQFWKPFGKTGDEMGGRGTYSVLALGRLKPEVSPETAQAEIDSIMKGLESLYPTNKGVGARLQPLYEVYVAGVDEALYLLWATSGLVLLVVGVNVASLLLARASEREREIAVRASLGAGFSRIVRQLLSESVVLALLGGLAGLLLATASLDWLLSASAGTLPRVNEVTVDDRVVGFGFLLALLIGIVFGLVPAFRAAGIRLASTLSRGGRQGDGVPQRLRTGLVVVQMALAFVLLVGAGLLIRSFVAVLQEEPGFTMERLLALQVRPPVKVAYTGPEAEAAYRRERALEREQMVGFYDRLMEKLGNVPGVESVTAVSQMPLAGRRDNMRVGFRGRPPNPEDKALVVQARVITPGYFRVMGIPLIRGRVPTEQDTVQDPSVIVISQSMARNHFKAEDPIGAQITTKGPDDWLTIVGIVADVRHALESEPQPTIYAPFAQANQFGHFRDWGMHLMVRTSEDASEGLVDALRGAVQSVDPNLPVSRVTTLDQFVADSMSARRFNMLLMSIFALVVLMLAMVGIYGVFSYLVSQRSHEIGIRMSLGAARGNILKMIVGRGLAVTLISIVVGLAGAAALTRYLQSLLFKMSPTDPVTLAGVCLLLTAVAMLACYIPARRATRVDPVAALRGE